jgi:transcriptional regulator with XRE-family HTH domain
MRAKSTIRLRAEKLRRDKGLSYKEISALTGINKSTLSGWLRDIPLQPKHIDRLQKHLETNRATFAARALLINRNRHDSARQKAREAGAKVANALPEKTAFNEVAFAMLYLGEGSKNNRRVQLANTDASIIRYCLTALQSLYTIEKSRLSLRLNLVEAARPIEAQLLAWWSQQLEIELHLFHKTQFDGRQERRPLTEDYHGVCTVNYNDALLQQRILSVAGTYIANQMLKQKMVITK